ncbi:MAG: isopeptide-forming domain-containing fimbrial protein [Litoreibacter sp.]|nr:isopeptide-forming domain-containing fimbrial protein [Litoreibacter sp.]
MPRFELLEDRIVLDGVPDVSFEGPSAVDLGQQDVGYTLVFDNIGTDTGYVPYVDLILPPGEDGDDGVTFDSASFLGTPIATTVLTFDAAGEATHPFAVDGSSNPIVVNGTPGGQLVVLELPYGSFSPGNPAIDIDLVLDFSPLADLDQAQQLQAIGGFALGCDPLDNPGADAPIRGGATTLDVDQNLFNVTKVNNVPEADAVSGPSYPYEYTLQVDVADGQTLSDFVLTDTLPPEIVYLGGLSISGATGTVTTEPPVNTLATPPDNEIVIEFPTITGPGPVVVTFDFYVNDDPAVAPNPVIDPATGDEAPVTNQVTGTATWDPLDGRDPVEVVSDSATDIIQARSIAVQKSNAVVTDAQVAGPTPDDIYEFTLNVQISDYFTFGDLLVTDILGNGWDYIDGSAELSFSQESGSSAAPISLTPFETSNFNAGSGETTTTWNVSAALGGDGLLTGDVAGDGTSSGAQTTATITYRAQILDAYPGAVSGTPALSQGDVLANNVTVSGTVRDNANPTTVIGSEDDTSENGIALAVGAIRSKEVYALNGNTAFDPAVPIAAGDTVTFRVIYDAPLGAFEDLELVDNLPQNVFDATEVTTFNAISSATPPAAGEAQFGPGDTFFSNGGGAPTLSIDAPNNGVSFDFSDLEVDPRQPVQVELLLTVSVVDAVFAPDLLLTNQVTAFETDSFGNTIDTTAIAQFEYSEPVLEITKGVVAFTPSGTGISLDAPVGPVTFNDPGTAGTRFTGTINSDALDTTPIDANIANVDAGDLVTFAIVIENTGRAPNGAFNVNVTDKLPAGFEIPTSGAGLNLNITDGTGAAVAFDGPAVPADIFTAGGLTLTDGAIEGAVSAFDATAGDNVIIVTYDLIVEDTITANESLTNTAAIAEYNAFEGNAMDVPVNRVPAGGLLDDATATTGQPSIDKVLDSQQFDEGTGNQTIVGEDFSYVITIDLFEGVLTNAVFTDVVTRGGLELIGAEIIDIGGGITNTNGLGVNDTVAATGGGNAVTFDFGTLELPSDNDPNNNSIQIRVDARAPDGLGAVAGDNLVNRARLAFDGGQVQEFLGQRVIEPSLSMDKDATPDTVSAGGTVNYSLDIQNIAGQFDAPAFDLELTDTLDPDLTLNTGSIQILLDGIDVTGNPGYTVTSAVGNTFVINVDRLNEGENLVVNYTGTVNPGVQAGKTIPNTADLTFDSTPEDEGVGTGAGDDSDDRDYSLSASEQVTAAAPDIDKSVLSSSFGDTSGTNLAIGEEVTYEIVVTIPDGNTTAVTLEDVLPTPGTTLLQYVSSQVISIGSDISGAGLPAINSMGSNVGATTTFSFGDLTNVVDGNSAATDVNDQIVIQLTALVVDDPLNFSGEVLTNTSTLDYTDGNGANVSVDDTADVTVVEPNLDIDKVVTPTTADAGDVLSYTVTSTNTGTGPAYDIIIDDDLADTGLSATGTPTIRILDAGGADVTPGAPDVPTVAFDGGGALQAVIPALQPGQTIEISYQATVTDAALFSSPVSNTAEVTRYDSDPAGDETTPNGRVYDSGLAGYTVPSDDADATTPDASLTKTLIGSNDANTPGDDVTIGEIVTYELVITLPQGTADLTLTDVMPAGLSALSATFFAVNNDSGLTSDIAIGADESDANITIAAGGDSVEFDFGTVVVPGENDGAARDTEIVVRIDARVEDIGAVIDGATLQNSATLEVVDPNNLGTDLQPDVVATETVDIVEPDVEIVKASPVGANQGDVVPYTINLTNNGAGPAYDMLVTDTLADPFLSLVSGTVEVFLDGVLLAPQPTITETAPDGFEVADLTLLPGQNIEIQFDVLLDANAPEAVSFPNTASAVYDTVDDDTLNTPEARDYSVSDNNTLATVPRVEKSPISSNNADTSSSAGDDPFQVAVGEEVTFEYVITLPEIAMDPVVLEDSLPVGMEYVSSAIVPVAGDLGASAPTVTVDPNNRDVTFDFGAINNPSDGSIGLDDTITFQVTAIVVDDAAATAGAQLTNTASIIVTPDGGVPLDPQTDTAVVEIVEPLLVLDKTAPLSVARGADADFTIEVTNDGPANGAAGPAYDVVIADTLDPAFTLDPASVVVRLDGAIITPTVTTTANTFSLTVPTIGVGQVVTVDYTAELDANAAPTVAYGNTATADYTSSPGANPDERSYPTVSDTETVSTDPQLAKSAIGSSDPLTGAGEHDATQLDLTIGEEVTFELVITLPEIPMDTVTLADTLPTGLTFVSASVDSVGAEVAFASNTITNTTGSVTYTFTDVTNTANGTIDSADEITVLVTALVTDEPGSVDGAELTNSATLTVTPQGEPALNPQTATADIDIVEPDLTVEKTGNIAVVPGQTVSYSATITNDGTAPAYDAFVQDTFANPFLSLVSGTVVVELDGLDVTSLLSITETATGFEFLLYNAGSATALPIEVGESLVVSYDAVLDLAAPEAQSFTNTISVDYDTVGDGDPDSPGGRDYNDTDDFAVSTVPFVDKTPISSSFTETDSVPGSTPFALAVGEEVTFQYDIFLPEIDMDSVVITDTLPVGMQYVSFNVVNFGVPAMTDIGGNPLTDPTVTVSGQDVTFDFGDVSNAFDGTIGPDDVIVLQVTAVITDDPAAVAGATLTNNVDLDVDPTGEPPFPTRENSAEVVIVEPLLELDKTGPLVVDTGDQVAYTLTIENVGPPGGNAGPAYDVIVTDTMPGPFLLHTGSLLFQVNGATITPTVSATTGFFSATIPVLEPNDVLTVTYTADVGTLADPTASYINAATVNYDSAPGDNPNERDYPELTDEVRTALSAQLEKTILSTGSPATGDAEHDPNNPDVGIGELITYQLVITLPEIPMDNVTLTDSLPTGLSFVSADITSVGSEISGVTVNDEATVVSTSGNDVILSFDNLTNAYSDNVIDANDQIVVEVTVRVDDLPSVNDGDVLTNSASLVVTPQGEGPLTPITDQTSVDVVEPDVDIIKDVSETEPMQGDTITYTVTVTNDAGATGPATNLVVRDPLPTGLSVTSVSLSGTPASVLSGSGPELVIAIPVLTPGDSVTITYDVFVGYTTAVLQDVINTATVTGGTSGDPNNPGRPITDSDSEIIEIDPVPFPVVEEAPRLVGGGIDDAQFLPILQIDPIFTGTAEYGSNVTISLYQLDGSLGYVRNVVADAGGHWIAIFPRVTLENIDDDFHQAYETSVLFREPVQYLDDRAAFDRNGAPIQQRTLFVGTELQDDTYNVTINHDRPSTLPQDRGMFNARVFFAPATIGEPFVRGDVLSVDEVFEGVVERTVKDLYAASVDPLATGLNRFNYEFLSEETAIPGGSAR